MHQFSRALLSCFSLALPFMAQAQKDLFESSKLAPRKGLIFSVNGMFNMPAADMADRFGNGYRIGISAHYKLKSNWIFGLKLDFLNGNSVKEDSLLYNVRAENGTAIGQSGQRLSVNVFQRGFLLGGQAGYIINTSKRVSETGILLLTGAGFMQHKILISDKSESVLSLQGPYRKGYDRLANGFYIEQYVGFLFLADNGLINFHIGPEVTFGFNRGRRDYLYDVARPGNERRFDMMFGIKGGWCIPIFKRKSEEFYFE